MTLSDDPALVQLDKCVQWLATAYWASDRTREQVTASFAGSRVFGVYDADGAQWALARAVTDGSSFCWLCDVIVDESRRGQGIGRWLVGSVLEQLKAEGVQRFLLGTRDAHGVYSALGFSPLRVPEVFMEIDERATRPTRDNIDPSVLTADS